MSSENLRSSVSRIEQWRSIVVIPSERKREVTKSPTLLNDGKAILILQKREAMKSLKSFEVKTTKSPIPGEKVNPKSWRKL